MIDKTKGVIKIIHLNKRIIDIIEEKDIYDNFFEDEHTTVEELREELSD